MKKNMNNEEKIHKSNHFSKWGIAFVILAIILIVLGATNFFVTGNVISGFQDNENVQIVKLKTEGSTYVLEPSTFKKGVPVRIEADMSQMLGCSRAVVISSFNVRKTVSTTDNIIEFVPDKAGTFNIVCSMNMYQGTFTVLDFDGKTSEYVEPLPTGRHTCGANSGGCGCGG